MLSQNSQLQEKRSRFLHRLSDNMEDVKLTTALQTFDQLNFKGFVAELLLYGLTYDEVLTVDPNTPSSVKNLKNNRG
jgi:hypothetical protein